MPTVAKSSSPLAKPLPASPKMARLRQEVSKKSPVRSPLREVLKKRCAERIRSGRDKVVAGFRGTEFAQMQSEMIKNELSILRGSRRKILAFGFSEQEVDQAIQDMNDIEVELLEYVEILSDDSLGTICPLCLKHDLKEIQDGGHHVVSCPDNCGQILKNQGGVRVLVECLEAHTEQHSQECMDGLSWSKADDCLVAFCDSCDFCTTIP